MKLAYEKPMMSAELYQTNSYCAGCDDTVKGTSWGISKANSTYFTEAKYSGTTVTSGTIWNENGNLSIGSGDNIFEFASDHTFDRSASYQTEGFCPGDNNHDSTQNYWKCTCHDGQYILEHSHYWSQHMNTNAIFDDDSRYNQVFFLYYDMIADGKLTLTGGTDKWPHGYQDDDGNWTSDIAVVMVSPNETVTYTNSW